MVWINWSGSPQDSASFAATGGDPNFAFGRKQYPSASAAISEWRMRGFGSTPEVRWHPKPGEPENPPPEQIDQYNRGMQGLAQASSDAEYRMYEAEQRRQELAQMPRAEQRPGEIGIVREGEVIQTPERRIQSDNRGGYTETRYEYPQPVTGVAKDIQALPTLSTQVSRTSPEQFKDTKTGMDVRSPEYVEKVKADRWYDKLPATKKAMVSALTIEHNIFSGTADWLGLRDTDARFNPLTFEPMKGFELESAKMGETTITYKPIVPVNKGWGDFPVLAYRTEQLYARKKGESSLDAFKRGMATAATRNEAAMTAGTIIAFSAGLGALARAGATGAKAASIIGTGVVVGGVGSATAKAITGHRREAFIEGVPFLLMAPAVASAIKAKIPTEKMFGSGYRPRYQATVKNINQKIFGGAVVGKQPTTESFFGKVSIGQAVRKVSPVTRGKPVTEKAIFGDTRQWIRANIPLSPKIASLEFKPTLRNMFGVTKKATTKRIAPSITYKKMFGKTPRVTTVNIRSAYLQKVRSDIEFKDYENLMKAGRWDLIERRYPTPEPAKQNIRTVDLSRELVAPVVDLSVPARRALPRITGGSQEAGYELPDIPKIRIPEPALKRAGKVIVQRDMTNELKSRWESDRKALDKIANKQGFFVNPQGQRTQSQTVVLTKQLQKMKQIPVFKQKQIPVVDLSTDLLIPKQSLNTILYAPPIQRQKTKFASITQQISQLVPKQIQRTVLSTRQKQAALQISQQRQKSIPIQIPRTSQVHKQITPQRIQQIFKQIVGQVPQQIQRTTQKQVQKFDVSQIQVLKLDVPFPEPTKQAKTKHRRKSGGWKLRNPFLSLFGVKE